MAERRRDWLVTGRMGWVGGRSEGRGWGGRSNGRVSGRGRSRTKGRGRWSKRVG